MRRLLARIHKLATVRSDVIKELLDKAKVPELVERAKLNLFPEPASPPPEASPGAAASGGGDEKKP